MKIGLVETFINAVITLLQNYSKYNQYKYYTP